MIFQFDSTNFDLENLTGLALVGSVLIAFVTAIILMIIISLFIWRYAIEKVGGKSEGLGDIFVTLFIIALITGIISVFFFPIIGASNNFQNFIIALSIWLIVSLLAQLKILSSRHKMSMGKAFLANIMVLLISFAILIGLLFIFSLIFGFTLF